ncbi:hypothetical protein HK405_015068 [Cladochytrium tenue]|nr:hypothetical protein HK405_015068 [Cladochytrium tenue]
MLPQPPPPPLVAGGKHSNAPAADDGRSGAAGSGSLRPTLFAGVWFFVNPLMGSDLAEKIRTILLRGGARESVVPETNEGAGLSHPTATDAGARQRTRFDLLETTHVVSTEIEFPEYAACLEAKIRVVQS